MTDVKTVHDHNQIGFERPGKSIYEVAFHYDGTWGNTLVPMTVINGTAGSGKSLICFGGTHGNEYEGQVAVWRLMHELDPAAISGRVILMPRLNTPACISGTRESPRDGVNMNRAFPGNPKGSLTYRIAHFVTSRIFPLVDIVLDIHSAGSGPEFALCSSFHQIPDRTQYEEMKYVAGLFDTPFIMVYSSEMASGLLTDEAEAMGKITIGSELGHSCGVLHQGVQHAYQGIKNVLHHYQMLPGEIQKIDPNRETPPKLVAALSLDEYVPAPITGVFEPLLKVGSPVEGGQLIGRLYDFERVGSPAVEITAPHSGYLLMQTFQAPVQKGDTMLVVAQEVID